MAETNLEQRPPRQRSSHQQQAGGDDLGGARSGRRRFGHMVVVVTVIAVAMVVMCIGRMGVRAMRVVMMLDLVAAGVTRMRAGNGDRARDEGADQRQKNDCLD